MSVAEEARAEAERLAQLGMLDESDPVGVFMQGWQASDRRCTCGWGGQHDPDNPRCAKNRVGAAPSDTDHLLLDDVRRARGAYPLDSDTVALLDRILETFSRTSQPVQVERPVTERIFDLFDELTSAQVEALVPAYFKTGEDARIATGVAPAGPVQVEVTDEETRILTIIDQHLPTVITGLQRVVYQSMHKSRDELTDDEVALRAALSAAHWIAKDLVTRSGKPLYDLPSVLDLLSMKRKDAERIAELEATVAALSGGEHDVVSDAAPQEDEWVTTASGARLRYVREEHGSWLAVRDDGFPIYRAAKLPEVQEYVRKFGDTFQPGSK